jgi:hypothetical protein
VKTTISLKDLLDTTFSINDNGEMVGEFTLKRINMIGDILTQQYKEIERLENIIKEVREYITSQKLHKIQDTTGALTYQEIKLLEILDKGDKE